MNFLQPRKKRNTRKPRNPKSTDLRLLSFDPFVFFAYFAVVHFNRRDNEKRCRSATAYDRPEATVATFSAKAVYPASRLPLENRRVDDRGLGRGGQRLRW